MSNNLKSIANDLEDAANTAAMLEAEAQAGPDNKTYQHTFVEPFQYQGRTITELTFHWGMLTGEDHQAIEDDMIRRGQTLVVPAFTGLFLAGMAVRACTDRDANGIRIVTPELLRALPMPDYQKIYMSARNFLLRSGS